MPVPSCRPTKQRRATLSPMPLQILAHSPAVMSLLQSAGVAQHDKGVIELTEPAQAASFVEACRKLRFWERELKVKRA